MQAKHIPLRVVSSREEADYTWRYVFSKRVVNRGGQSVADNIAGHIREVVVKARKRRPTV